MYSVPTSSYGMGYEELICSQVHVSTIVYVALCMRIPVT